ncbi:kynureninase [Luteipulveratus flavus]|uniref:Kynureninase n=1 Tax=Luteipulveratus flavus TaxID=3031728 RepID=A0ABT6C1Y6_9MICO|nr:kynureninase [Luteipulveratus sp. YIM 133296]MDF8262665.1 kynureninase [Luteipulveratus sp. YIM 133296]
MTSIDISHCRELDHRDDLAHLRDEFVLPEGVTYLVGNSLGPMPRAVPERMQEVVTREWAQGLVGSWNDAGWFDQPLTLGDRLAPLVGAGPGQVVVCDTTSLNLFKVVGAALQLRPERRTIVAEAYGFPTDVYMLESMATWTGQHRLALIEQGGAQLDDLLDQGDVAAVVLNHVDYRTGDLLDMAAVTEKVHAAGALAIWDLCHSAGALEIDLPGCDVDFAIGCTYKYLNAGPGSPAYLYVAPRLQADAVQPLSGWHGHAAPFAFTTSYEPAAGISRFRTSSPSILSFPPLAASLDLFASVDMAAVRRKSQAMTDLFIALVDQELGDAVEVASPRDADRRGSQVALRHPHGYQVMRALIERGVQGDFRAPDLMRFGFTPLYLRYEDVWTCVATVREVLETETWRSQPEPSVTAAT